MLDDFIPFRSHKYKVTVNCLYRRRKSKGDPKSTSLYFRTEEYMTKDFRLDINQWLDYSKETYKGYGYDNEFIGMSSIQLNQKKIKPS